MTLSKTVRLIHELKLGNVNVKLENETNLSLDFDPDGYRTLSLLCSSQKSRQLD